MTILSVTEPCVPESPPEEHCEEPTPPETPQPSEFSPEVPYSNEPTMMEQLLETMQTLQRTLQQINKSDYHFQFL